MANGFTPGEWIAECVGDTGGPNPQDVWEVHNVHTRIAEYMTGPDAKLCAAAPLLLASLIEARDCLIWDSRDEELGRANAAIAKALGRPHIRRIP